MSNLKAEQAGRYRSVQVLLFIFSLIFFAIICYGYFHLLVGFNYFVAIVGAGLMAIFAWYLARVIGTDSKGIRGNLIFFIPLLIVSSAGVYNSLMLYLEGGRILSDTVAESQASFAQLQGAAESGLGQSGATNRLNRIRSLSEALFSEIRNPLNCGQGQEARRLIAELQRELPGFTPLSNPAQNCARNEELIADYRERIAALIVRADWNNPTLNTVITDSNQARRSLETLRSEVATSYTPTLLRRTVSGLETLDSVFRDLRLRASRHIDVRDIPEGLHLSEVQSLGNAFKLPALFFERLDEWSTYVYLAVALLFDILMISLFQRASANRVRPSAAGHLPGAY